MKFFQQCHALLRKPKITAFSELNKPIFKSNIGSTPYEFKAGLVVIPILTFIFTAAVSTLIAITVFSIKPDMILVLLISTVFFLISFVFVYYYPEEIISTRNRKINSNLPYALNYMSAIIDAGVTPLGSFKTLSELSYGEVSIESKKLVSGTNLGQDMITAMDERINYSPSKRWADILNSLKISVQSGGNIRQMLAQKAQGEQKNLSLEISKYLVKVETITTFYITLFVLVPLLILLMAAIFNVINSALDLGGDMTFTITVLIFFVLPAANMIFFILLRTNRPEVF
ncbi:MAG: type II secretion system F family protein [Candidatus Diapherotrites archaeon]|nr:type II secretion system F family protein [Candidatus Diapherotrites archaeon]